MLPLLWASLALAADPLDVPQPVIDAGERKAGQPLVVRFTLNNVNREPLVITDLSASCGCAKPVLDERTIAPGAKAEVALDVNTLSQPAGPNRWALNVGWRSGRETGRRTLELTATLVREIEFTPAALVLTAGRPHEVTLTDRRPTPLRVTGVRTDSPRLVAELLPATGSARAVRLRVADDCPEGRHSDALRVTTNDPAYPELVLQVTLVREPRARVTASPSRVSLAPGGPTVLVQLRDAAGKPVIVERIEAPGVTARWAAGPGTFSTLRLGCDSAKSGGVVRVVLREPAGEVVTIPVTVREE